MPSLHITARTSVSKEQFIAALTDFGPNRGNIWGNSRSSHLTLHTLEENYAEVTEGSNVFGGAWERLEYDWSNPNSIELRTIESNIWAQGSGWKYKLEDAHDGSGTVISARVTRYPSSKKGYLILFFVGSVGRPLIKRGFRNTLRAIEQRAYGT